MNQFWTPRCITADKAWTDGDFKSHCSDRGIRTSLVPSNTNSNIAIKSKHGIGIPVFLKPRSAIINAIEEVHALQSVFIPTELYKNDILSAFELAKFFTRSI